MDWCKGSFFRESRLMVQILLLVVLDVVGFLFYCWLGFAVMFGSLLSSFVFGRGGLGSLYP